MINECVLKFPFTICFTVLNKLTMRTGSILRQPKETQFTLLCFSISLKDSHLGGLFLLPTDFLSWAELYICPPEKCLGFLEL